MTPAQFENYLRALKTPSGELEQAIVRSIPKAPRNDLEWRTLLYEAAEVVHWSMDTRPQVVALLCQEALDLSSRAMTGYERPLSIILRTVALIGSEESIAPLILQLLSPESPPQTKQAALNAIRILYSSHPIESNSVSESTLVEALRRRLSQLLDTYLNVELISNIAIGALILSAFAASAAICHPDLERHAVHAVRILPLTFRKQIIFLIDDIQRVWQCASPVATQAVRILHNGDSSAMKNKGWCNNCIRPWVLCRCEQDRE